MHELTVAYEIYQFLSEFSEERVNGAGDIKEVVVEVGAFSCVMPPSLQSAFSTIVEDTPFQHAKLIMKKVPPRIYCPHCKKAYVINIKEIKCPNCSNTDLKLVSGDDLKIKEIRLKSRTEKAEKSL